MPLTAGARFGRYVIQVPLSAGGMGDVYLAEDTELHRRVALKLLHGSLVEDDNARRRLVHEAQAAAALDHPNICTIYDVGQAEGQSYIAMQYIEGETVAERLKRGPLDIHTALVLGRQIAEALGEAHRIGIIHRDVKPQNVILTRQNQAKVLDFGIAKMLAPTGTDLRTVSALTGQGLVPGTTAYMSPEQARGEAVDQRSDIFSFGIVLFEIVSRAHPFAHQSSAETTSAILTRDPAISDIAAPAELRRILRKCLEKDRDRRYQTMRDVAIDLENLARDLTAPATAVPQSHGPNRARWVWSIVAALAALVGVVALWFSRPSPAPSTSDYEQLTNFADSAVAPSLSPDGRTVAFIRGGAAFLSRSGQIYVKQLPNGEAVRLTNDVQPKFAPVFSPDGLRVAYTLREVGGIEGWNTWTVPVSGGPPTRMLPNATGLTWIDDRHILFSEILPTSTIHMGLATSTQNRAEARRIYVPSHERGMAHFSYLSPDRSSVLVVEMTATGAWGPCRVIPFDGTNTGRQVGPEGECRAAAWSPDGRWMYFSAFVGGVSHLWRQRFPNGSPEALTSGYATEEEGVAVAPDGRSLITSLGRRQSSVWLHDTRGERLISAEGLAFDPTLSADGARVYYLLRRLSSETVELTVVDPVSGRSDRLLPDFSVLDYDISRDERQVVFTTAGAAGERQVWLAPLDRRSAPRQIVRQADQPAFASSGRVIFRSLDGHVNYIDRINLDATGRERVSTLPIVDIRGTSPDGRVVLTLGAKGDTLSRTLAIPVDGGPPALVCAESCRTAWSTDGSRFFIWKGFFAGPRPLLVVPVPPGRTLPEFPADGTAGIAFWSSLPGVEASERDHYVPSSDSARYVFTKADELRNLYRIPVTGR